MTLMGFVHLWATRIVLRVLGKRDPLFSKHKCPKGLSLRHVERELILTHECPCLFAGGKELVKACPYQD